MDVVRAGYSANASMILEKKDSVLSISESVVQYDRKTGQSYVEIEISEQKFEKKDILTGISDGINVEVLSGISEIDKIKIWNITEPYEEERGFEKIDSYIMNSFVKYFLSFYHSFLIQLILKKLVLNLEECVLLAYQKKYFYNAE